MAEQYTLEQYISDFHDWFVIDEPNKELIKALNHYCAGSKSFETINDRNFLFNDQNKLYLDKGLFISGNIGTGKTELLKMINRYYKYLNSPRTRYGFRISNISDLADAFSVKGRDAFSAIKSGNWMFDEACFINEKTGRPDREYAINYGDKILIGEKVIYDRYTVFMETGWQSHFTTNATLAQLKEHYGERAYSRLMEMCNVFFYVGSDRRINKKPILPVNRNKSMPVYVPAPVEQPKETDTTTEEEQEFRLKVEDEMAKTALGKEFLEYSRHRNAFYIGDDSFDLLRKLGCPVEEGEGYRETVAVVYPTLEGEAINEMANKYAVCEYYSALITSGKKTLEFPK